MIQSYNEQVHVDLAVLVAEPAEAYHARSEEYLSSHQLADFMRCPYLYHKKQAGLLDDRDSNTLLVGRAAHVRFLEGQDAYRREFAIGGPINPTTGRPFGTGTKAFAEWTQAQAKPVLTLEQAALIEQMAHGVAMNDRAVDLLVYGQAEGVVRAEYSGVRCQIRLDWLNPHAGIVDLKTCDDLTWFEADAKRYGYPRQMAFYRAVLAQALCGQLVPVHMVAIEKKEPFRCGVWRLSDETLAIAQRENEAAIGRLKQCRQTGRWPTGYEDTRILSVA